MMTLRAAAKSLHVIAAVVGFAGGWLVIAAQALEYRAVRIERAGDDS